MSPHSSVPAIYVAFGKVSGLWHVVAGDLDTGLRLQPLTPRRRNRFTAAELVTAARFLSIEQARVVGRACGFERTYAEAAPADELPPTAELVGRRIVRLMQPHDASEAAELAAYIAAHPLDRAALHALPLDAHVRAAMLQQMRARTALARATGTVTAANLPEPS